jgi:hypothetical protein
MPVPAGPVNRADGPPSLHNILHLLGFSSGARYRPDRLPFLRDDATLGAESEMQAAVAGDAEHRVREPGLMYASEKLTRKETSHVNFPSRLARRT